MRRTMMAIIVFMTTVVGLYVFDVAFGQVLDTMYVSFYNLTPTLNLPAAWDVQADLALARWQMIYRSIVVIVIAVGVWVVLTAVGDNTYGREFR
jgi:hypothetical protein